LIGISNLRVNIHSSGRLESCEDGLVTAGEYGFLVSSKPHQVGDNCPPAVRAPQQLPSFGDCGAAGTGYEVWGHSFRLVRDAYLQAVSCSLSSDDVWKGDKLEKENFG
jgi:hypothetical protein